MSAAPILSWPDLPRTRLLAPVAADLRVTVAALPAPPAAPLEIDAAWAEMRRANDRLHDGPILAAQAVIADRIECVRSTYKALATQHHPAVGDRGVRLLGIKGLITGHDRTRREHVLIARRSGQTRIYGGQWEIAPGGGIDVPAPAVEITRDDIVRTLVHEAGEEMGVHLSAADCGPVAAIVLDDEALSVDLILPVRWPKPVDPRRGLCNAGDCDWEYLDAAWLATSEVGGFARASPGAITPPTLAVWRWLGWLDAPAA